MDNSIFDKEGKTSHIVEIADEFIDSMDPTKLIDIEFYKSYGLWDEEVSMKYNLVVKKWEKIKNIRNHEKDDYK
jgi:hypothetical protein